MKPQEYITDQKAFVTSLFEQAFGKRIDYVLKHWKDYLNMVPSGADTLLDMAYLFAQNLDKEDMAFYGFLCYWHACRHWHCDSRKMEFYREALQYCKDNKMRKDIELNYQFGKELLDKETCKGIDPDAIPLIEGIERLQPYFAENSGRLHDAQVKWMAYDRDKATLDIDLEFYSVDDDCKKIIIPFHFIGLLSVEENMDYGNDYVWESRIYEYNGYIYVEFSSVYLKVASHRLSIGEIRHDS